MTMTEYGRMRPRQAVEARLKLPAAFIGLGILEWHGLHNPLGLDGLKADGLARRLAGIFGGAAMPPQWWGDNRDEICERHLDQAVGPLPPRVPASELNHGDLILEHMKLTREAFAEDAERSRRNGGWRLWKELMVHTFHQIQTLGFEMIVAIPGHYPLFSPLEEAIQTYAATGGKSLIFVLKDTLYAEDGTSGDHAAAFETSLLMRLEPELVSLDELDSDLSKPNIGVALGPDPRTEANSEYGQRILGRFEDLVEMELNRFFQTTTEEDRNDVR